MTKFKFFTNLLFGSNFSKSSGDLIVNVDEEEFGTATYTDGYEYYPIFAYYFNIGEYAIIKNLKIIKI